MTALTVPTASWSTTTRRTNVGLDRDHQPARDVGRLVAGRHAEGHRRRRRDGRHGVDVHLAAGHRGLRVRRHDARTPTEVLDGTTVFGAKAVDNYGQAGPTKAATVTLDRCAPYKPADPAVARIGGSASRRSGTPTASATSRATSSSACRARARPTRCAR